MNLTTEFKNQVVSALKEVRKNFEGSDSAFAKQWSINASTWSQLKSGVSPNGQLRDTQWLTMGRELGITPDDRKWNAARTSVFRAIENDVTFCQANAKGMLLVDDTAIGKTFSAKYLAKTLRNCFYIDGSQCKTKQVFIRTFARTIGLDTSGRYNDLKNNIKYYLRMLTKPVIIIDEAGDLDYKAFLELKEFWNATEGACGWYLMGADGLRAKIESGIAWKKVGYRELFSRYSDKFMKIVPADRQERIEFYRQLITDVLSANMDDKTSLPALVKKCLANDANNETGGLRRAETLLILHKHKK